MNMRAYALVNLRARLAVCEWTIFFFSSPREIRDDDGVAL